ncbi:MAG: SpoIVB peptidase [Clostridiales bacterium]|nr:SpoIVB peptidase [Clostridiales bacterium]
MSKIKKLLLVITIFLFLMFSICFPYQIISDYQDGMFVTEEELDTILENNLVVSSRIINVSADSEDKYNEYTIKYKLFNLFDIKKLKVNVIEPDRFFAGGDSLGFSLSSKGVVLIGGNYIISDKGIERPFEDSDLKSGDIILRINDEPINNVEDISDILKNHKGGELKLGVARNNEEFETYISPALDVLTKTYKLGLWVKEDAVGIGTLTFINVTTGRFGSLGHAINDSDSNTIIDVSGGNIYEGKILSVKRGENGRAGELIGTFSKENVIGSVDKNCEYGVYGYLDEPKEYVLGRMATEIGGRVSVTPGSAKILSCIDGQNIEEFDIEIIKTNFQSSCNEKSMVIRVVDKDLIARTGGIVQGMSGSPIIQNDKLVGAVTHVFVNDPTKGFGIYIDWMLEQ